MLWIIAALTFVICVLFWIIGLLIKDIDNSHELNCRIRSAYYELKESTLEEYFIVDLPFNEISSIPNKLYIRKQAYILKDVLVGVIPNHTRVTYEIDRSQHIDY